MRSDCLQITDRRRVIGGDMQSREKNKTNEKWSDREMAKSEESKKRGMKLFLKWKQEENKA